MTKKPLQVKVNMLPWKMIETAVSCNSARVRRILRGLVYAIGKSDFLS